MKTRVELAQELSSWLEAERGALERAWRRDSIEPLMKVSYRLLSRSYEGTERSAAWTFACRFEEPEVSRFTSLPGHSASFKFTQQPPADDLLEIYGEDAFEAAVFDGKGSTALDRARPFLSRLAGDYLASLANVFIADDRCANSAIASYLSYLEHEPLTDVEEIPIGGITPPVDPVDGSHHGVTATVRPLTEREFGELPVSFLVQPDLLERPTLPLWTKVGDLRSGTEGCMLSVRQQRSKNETKETRAAQLVFGLQLLGYSICGRGYGSCWSVPGPRFCTPAGPLLIPRGPEYAPERPVNSDELKKAIALTAAIPEGAFTKPRSRPDIAVHRFALATSHEEEAEAIIDYAIAIEAILLPGMAGELTYRLALNGARFIGATEPEREEIFGQLKAIYAARSKLVHGGTSPDKEYLGDMRRSARELGARLIIKCLQDGWPSEGDLQSAVLA